MKIGSLMLCIGDIVPLDGVAIIPHTPIKNQTIVTVDEICSGGECFNCEEFKIVCKYPDPSFVVEGYWKEVHPPEISTLMEQLQEQNQLETV